MVWLSNFWRRLTGWFANLWRRFFGWLTVPRAVALLLGLLGVLIAVGGYLYRYCACQDWPNLVAGWEQLFLDFYANVATTLVGITVAVLTIDLLNERRAEQQLKAQLIREMGHRTDNGIALKAVEELRAQGWLEDGSLHRATLEGANLQGADLNLANLQGVNLQNANLQGIHLLHANLQEAHLADANLQGADLRSANLQGVNLRHANLQETFLSNAKLQKANLRYANLQEAHLDDANLQGAKNLIDQQIVTLKTLRGTTMPEGSRYDGRFRLDADLWDLGGMIKSEEMDDDFSLFTLERISADLKDPEAMARWYGVSLEDYLAGQEWARENLERVRREAKEAAAMGNSIGAYLFQRERARENLPQLRREAGLAQEEAAETADAPQPEEPQRAAPSSSAPTSPVVPAQSLLSFTVRRLIGLFWPFGR